MKKSIKLFTTVMVCMAMALCVSCKKDDNEPGGGNTGGGTQTVATVTTEEVTEITQTTAVCGGEVKSENGWAVTERGVCWGVEPNPTPSDNCTVDGDGIGKFTSVITGLIPGTTYYVRAYAKNAAGTGFGAERSFTTLENGGGGGGRFSVSSTTTVEFAPGNLYWDGSAFRFEANQWDFRHYNGKTNDAAVIGGESTTTPAGTVGSFFWSKTASVAYASSYSGSGASTSDVFFTNATKTTANPNFHVSGETAGTWRTLSKAEWNYLLNSRANASSLRAWKGLDGGTHKGLVILPDGTDVSVMSSITKTSALATYGAVFLPAAGSRSGTGVYLVGSNGYYWSSTPYEDYAYGMYFYSGLAITDSGYRDNGSSVRLVR